MGRLLKSMRETAGPFLIEENDNGFAVVRREIGQADAFNAFARRILEQSGSEYVALPRSDGPSGYDRIFVIPFGGE